METKDVLKQFDKKRNLTSFFFKDLTEVFFCFLSIKENQSC